ncbi:MAG: autotransporter assembly complex family protein [Thiobacillus sp.]|jgi:translocation and assembly module TamA|uniref:autotransporter assembly complex protein TamA n=1 Tax=Thiobacillus sp. TaxID=924 RepID=UPI0028948300|nr:autotransporter assembly complex family protein [Thiobacillus sp.]MDT3707654.1 autotransporter assembly complex family protein [Thiobacillus sp.]
MMLNALLLLAMLFAMPAHALTVTVDAPEELEALLTQHLEAARAARRGETLDEAELLRLRELGVETARELLATEGYFSPQIESNLVQTEGDWVMRYAVTPGPLTRVRMLKIGFEGGLADSEQARLRARTERSFTLQPQMPFRQADWNAAKLMLLRPLLAGRYPAARIAASEARVDPVLQAADLTLTVDSGPAFFYGQPVISGYQRYPEAIIRNLNPMKPGKPVRQQDLLDYQIALETSGYFAQATVRIEPDPALAAAVPIQVEVVERPEKMFSVGTGYSTDTGARVQASWLHRDILDRGLRLKFDAKLETDRQTGGVELAWPRNARGYEHSVGALRRQEDIEGQETRSNVLGVKRSLARGQIESTLSLQYQSEEQEIGDVVDVRNQALTANYAWTQRRVGRAFYPRRGYVLTLQGGGALEAVLSDTTFARLYGRHTHYFRAGENGRVILRGELGSVLAQTREGIPTDFLFRAGGDNSVRGYAYQSLGRTLEGGVASVRYLATGSVEYNYFFEGNWGMAVFVDAGDAADTPGALSPVFGYGVGARYRSPVGPVNLDVAYGEATDEIRLHFSLGVSF